MQYFIGLTFAQHYLQYKKIDSFRKRYDRKYLKGPLLQMTLLPPFQVNGDFQHKLELWEHIEEVFEDYLHDLTEVGSIVFNGFEFTNERKPMLYLKPAMPVDLYHCQESLFELLKSYNATCKLEKKPHEINRDPLQTFLPLGRFQDRLQLEMAIETARLEFDRPFALPANHITLFEKMPGAWVSRRNLFNFPLDDEDFSENGLNLEQIQKLNMRI